MTHHGWSSLDLTTNPLKELARDCAENRDPDISRHQICLTFSGSTAADKGKLPRQYDKWPCEWEEKEEWPAVAPRKQWSHNVVVHDQLDHPSHIDTVNQSDIAPGRPRRVEYEFSISQLAHVGKHFELNVCLSAGSGNPKTDWRGRKEFLQFPVSGRLS